MKKRCISPSTRIVPLLLVVGYLLIFGFNAITRVCDFSDPDTMNFVDVAENIKSGAVIGQSTIGFNVPRLSTDVTMPMPMTSQPPVYPLLIALFSLTGLSSTVAAQLISIISYGFILFGAYLLVARLYDEQAAWFAVAVLLLYQPLQKVASTTFSESLGIMFAMAALVVLVRSPQSPAACRIAFLAGLLTGLAFATRYALIPLVCAGCLYLWCESRDRTKATVSYVIGFFLVAGLIWLRNIKLIGTLMPEPNPSQVGLAVNVKKGVLVLLRPTPDSLLSSMALAVGLLLLFGLIILLIRQRRFMSSIKSILFDNGRYVLPIFMAGYLCFLILQRTRVHFDHINWRLILPAGIAFCMIFAAALSEGWQLQRKYRTILFSLLLLVLQVQQVAIAIHHPRFSSSSEIAGSERLSWINKHTEPRDLIIGIDTVDVVFYLKRPAYSISAFPYCDYLTYRELVRVCRSLQSNVGEIFLILPLGEEQVGGLDYGPFLRDMMNEQGVFSGLNKHVALRHHLIYRVVVDELKMTPLKTGTDT